MSLPAAPEWFTARELADLVKSRGLTGFPASVQGMIDLARREGWDAMPERFCRKRPGRGGATEYHVSLLPERLQRAISARLQQTGLIAALSTEVDADRRKLAALRSSTLSSDARLVMETRAEILRAIEGYAVARQMAEVRDPQDGRARFGRGWAIAEFLQAQSALEERQDIERRRDSGQFLTPREAASLAQPLVLTAQDGFDLSPAKLVAANDRRGRARISRATLYEWFKARDERGVVALAPVPTKVAEPIPASFHDFMKFYAIPTKPSIADAHRHYREAATRREGVQRMTLTLDQVKRILKVRLSDIERNVGREGILTLRSRMSYITRTTEDMWPTTIYTGDGKTFDAEVADPVSRKPMRPEITSILDVATRKCVGYAVSRKENVIAVTEGLRRSCVNEGIPAIFYTDRGGGYKNKTFDADVGGLMGRLGITKMHALPYNSQAKGIIERFNHVWNDLAKQFPTYIGADMDKEAGKAIHKETRGEIVEFGTARRLPSWADFVAAVEDTIAAYNDRPHTGLPRFEDPATGRLRHMSPNEAWAAHVASGFEPVPVDPDEVDDLFRPYESRKVNRALVEWNTNTYFHESLERYHQEWVSVGYDLNQADRVWVREFDVSSGQPGKLICVAVFSGNAARYVPLTAEQKALETRNKAALRRLDRKREDKEAELGGAGLIDHVSAEPAPFMTVPPDPVPEPVRIVADSETPTPRRRVFDSDEELAAWALEHPEELAPNQIAVLRECMSRPAAREFFRMSGIDVEALRTLLRAAA